MLLKNITKKLPSQAVCNKVEVHEIPEEISVLEKFEQILIAQKIIFEKVVIYLKVNRKKLSVQFAMYQLTVIKIAVFCHDL